MDGPNAVRRPAVAEKTNHGNDAQVADLCRWRGDRRRRRRGGQASAIGEPLGQESIVLGPALRDAELPEIDIPAIQGDDSLAGRPVQTIGRGTK